MTLRVLLLGAAALSLSSVIEAQAPAPRGKTSSGVVEVSPARNAANPEVEAVERADAAARDFDEAEITDPTVFVKSAALGGMTAIELAKLAQSKAQAADIRTFAARMLKDYPALDAELAAIARRKHMDVPTSLDYEDEQIVNEASDKSGPEFDAWYARQMMAEHQKAVSLFQIATKMQDADLAAFAKKALPTLDEHQRMALSLASRDDAK